MHVSGKVGASCKVFDRLQKYIRLPDQSGNFFLEIYKDGNIFLVW